MVSKVHANATIKILNCICILLGINFKNEDQIVHIWNSGDKSLVHRLHYSEIDTLTRDNCIQIQLLLEEVSRECLIYLSEHLTDIYDFIDNLVQLRIAVAIFSDKTWYDIRKFHTEKSDFDDYNDYND